MSSVESKQQNLVHNLIGHMAPYIDPHQLLRMLEFQKNLVNPVFDTNQLQMEELKIMQKTAMYERTWNLEKEIRRLPEDTPMDNEYQTKYDRFDEEHEKKIDDVDTIKQKFDDTATNLLQQGKDNNRLWVALKEDCGFVEEDLSTLFDTAVMYYNCGDYEEADSTLYLYRMIAPYDHSKHLSSQWGDIANAIQLMSDEDRAEKKFEDAVKSLDELKETIDKSTDNCLKTLQNRAWLLHFALFIYFSKEARTGGEDTSLNKSTEYLITLCLNTADKEENPYKNAIETICPWLLRYLAVIIVTSKTVDKKNFRLRKLVEVIKQEENSYSDPITNFLLCLNKHYDFEAAQKHLVEAREVLRSDYFLHPYVDQFIENGRALIFEMYCRIHKKIKVESIAEKLDMTQEDAELWIVELIRNARLQAKIDGENGNIIMGSDPIMPHAQILSKTSNLSMATQMLIKNLDKKMKASNSALKDAIPSWARHNSVSAPVRSPRNSYKE